MRTLTTATLIGFALTAAPALAWNENMTQPASNEMPVWAYQNANANYCPAGLQPVVVGGVVCCGTPTHTGYQGHPPARGKRYKSAPVVVSYGKGHGETIVYEKGQ